MNILLIGNGFDLAHGLPTKYTDFLDFCKRVRQIFMIGCKTFEREYLDNWDINIEIKERLKEEYNRREIQNNINADGTYSTKVVTQFEHLNDLYENTKENIWINYFLQCNTYQKENWIDFESEISNVIKSIDNDMYGKIENSGISLDSEVFELSNVYLQENYLNKVLDEYKNSKSFKRKTYRKIRDRLHDDLNKFIRAFEIYLTEYVAKINIKVISPDIKDIAVKLHENDGQKRAIYSKVLSFNYTNTYWKMYLSKYTTDENDFIDYIHGKANIDNSIESNNMVLGIDEYLSPKKRNKRTEFIAFKKYYQRIHKETGCKYKEWVNKIQEDYYKYVQIQTEKETQGKGYFINDVQTITNRLASRAITDVKCKRHNLFIFGHSLDITDKDVLRDLILNNNVYTTIFYYNKELKLPT